MNAMEKFYSDSRKLIKICRQNEFDAELAALFCRAVSSFDKQCENLANDFADYRLATYGENGQTKEEAAEWFYKLFSLLAGHFEPDMDFSDEDWKQINLTVSAEAGEMNIDLLNSILSVMVERKKI